MSESTLLGEREGNTAGCVKRVSERRSGVVRPDACTDVSCAELGRSRLWLTPNPGKTGSGEFKVSPDTDGDGKSDRPIVVKKQTNKSTIEHQERTPDSAGGVCGAKGSDREKFERAGVMS